MISSLLIIGFSMILLVYWFRYTCLLILSAKSSKDYSAAVAESNQLSFVNVRQVLRGECAAPGGLDQCMARLDRDYRLLTYLLSHTGLGGGDDAAADRLLCLNYRFLRVWYAAARLIGVRSEKAVEETATIIGHFANRMGMRTFAHPA